MTAQAPRLFTHAGLAVVLAAAGLGLPAVGTARAAGSATTVPCATGCTYADQGNVGEVDFPAGVTSAKLIMRGADGGSGGSSTAAGGAGGAGGTWTVTVVKPASGKLFLYIGSVGGSNACSGEAGSGGLSGGFDEGVVTGGDGGAPASGTSCVGGGGGGATFVMSTDELSEGQFDQNSVLAVAGGGGGGGGGSSTSPGGRGGDGGQGAASEDGQPSPGTSGGLSGNNGGAPGGGFPSGGSDYTTDGGGGGGGGFVGGGSGTDGGGGGGGCQYPQTGATGCVPEEAGVIRQAHAARHAKHDAKPHRSAPPTPAAAPKAIAVPASLTKPDPPKHKRVHIAALGQGGQVQVVFPGNTPPINPPPPAGHHGTSSNDPGVDASNDPDRQRPDTDQMVCSPLAGICSVNPPPGANTVFTISASGGNESATLFGTLYGGSHPSCPGYTPVTDDWVAFGFRDASAGRSWHKAGTLTTRQSLGRAGAAAQLRRLQICFAAPYRFRTGAGYRMGRDGDGEWTGVLPSCRAAAAPCISHRSLVRQGPGWVARIEFRAPAGRQDPKALG
ncbi:MAG TPA: glycine-rich protein [Sporichthyaceae bacterium]|nr:glycine-rich protein [Sporichthyaceae bacterium]